MGARGPLPPLVSVLVLVLCLAVSVWVPVSQALHVSGTFRPADLFQFVAKFGFQKTESQSGRDSFGYIFGNVSGPLRVGAGASAGATLAVLDRPHFLKLYAARPTASTLRSSRVDRDRDHLCRLMFADVGPRAYDAKCAPKGQDFLRRAPCPAGKLCPDEDTPSNVLPGHQFTYVIQNLGQPRYWYISMVACYRNTTTCKWEYYNRSSFDRPNQSSLSNENTSDDLHYDFWIVNGNPNLSAYNTLLFQFSFDRQNTVELYLLFWACYIILVPLQIYAVRSQKHPITRLFTCSLLLEFIGLCLIVVHVVKFAFDGVGFVNLQIAGDILDILSRTAFMLLLLLLAKGWAVTRIELTWKPVVFGIWLCYGVIHILLYIWNMTEVDIIEEIDEYQTWPGWLILAFRVLIMLWFIYELRNTMLYEHNMVKLNFLLHFGASSLVWFIYLPIIALIALQISPLWRFKFLLGITYSADCLAFFVMAHLLWPTRSEQYLLLTSANYTGMEELDEFNESPHVVHSSTDWSLAPLQTHPEAPDAALRENLTAENADEDEVLFTALQMNHNNHKLLSSNTYG
ncbi:uncharacterized protein LOC143915082 [Arctopsyche grandis]|uniref:uncharacterized protein LOC143915082 n=1 Tax=Arctopsyche grandis TaxID=121162 RepID=UPI00406D9AB4